MFKMIFYVDKSVAEAARQRQKKTKWLRPLLRLLPSRAVKYEASPSREAEYGCNKLH